MSAEERQILVRQVPTKPSDRSIASAGSSTKTVSAESMIPMNVVALQTLRIFFEAVGVDGPLSVLG